MTRFAGTTLLGIMLSMLLLALAACDDSTPVDPQANLARASANMKSVEGFHFVFEAHYPGNDKPTQGFDVARIIGEVNNNGDMQARVDVTQRGIPLKVELVICGDMQYIQNPLSGKWQSVSIDESPVGDLRLNAGTILLLDNLSEVTYQGRKKKGGKQTYHITGTSSAEDVKAVAGAVATTDPFPIEVYIGVDDGYVYEIDIYGPALPRESEGMWRSIVLSELGTAFDIKAPQ